MPGLMWLYRTALLYVRDVGDMCRAGRGPGKRVA